MHELARLLAIMACLRDPQRGRAWDLAQTFDSIAPYTLEEAYEVVGAIEGGDLDHLKDELGDLLLQVVYHAQIARERGLFDFDAVVASICHKLQRRQPQLLGSADAADSAWEAEKARERGPSGVLDGVAEAQPALSRARKLQARAARVGFDWPDVLGTFAKVEEELAEVEEVLRAGDEPERIREEVGDLLFAAVNLARKADVDPEQALRQANRKFERRFQGIEARLAHHARKPEDCNLQELDTLWEAVKRDE